MSAVLIAQEEVAVARISHEVLNEQSLQAVWPFLEEPSAAVLHLDLSAIRFPTAEGLGALVVLNKELRARGVGLLLVNVPSAIHEVLSVTHLVEVLDVRTE